MAPGQITVIWSTLEGRWDLNTDSTHIAVSTDLGAGRQQDPPRLGTQSPSERYIHPTGLPSGFGITKKERTQEMPRQPNQRSGCLHDFSGQFYFPAV